MTEQQCPQCDGYGTVFNTAVISILHDMSRSLENKRKLMDEYFKAYSDQHVLNACNWCRGRVD